MLIRFVCPSCSVLVVPLYLNAVTIVMGAIRNRLRKTFDKVGQKVRVDGVYERFAQRRRGC